METRKIEDGRIVEIDNGVVTVNKVVVGSVMQDLKFGYHPVVRAKVEENIKDYEIDNIDVDVIMDWIVEKI